MADFDESWEFLQEIARDQLRQVLGRCILPLGLPELRQRIETFCSQAPPVDGSEFAERQCQLRDILQSAEKSL